MTAPALAPPARLDAVDWIDLPSHGDDRGVLTAVESGLDLPFEVRRVYLLHHLQGARGGHAHRDTHQVVIAAAGAIDLRLSEPGRSRTWRLDDPTRGLYLGPMLYIEMPVFEPGTVVVVLASTHYDKTRSLRSWEEYVEACRP